MPGTIRLQLITPLGMSEMMLARRALAAAEKTRSGAAASASSNRTPASAVRYSLESCAPISAMMSATPLTSSGRIDRTASASIGMALFWAPPNGLLMRTSNSLLTAVSTRVSTCSALARSSWISNSQWPPLRPRTRRMRVSVSSAGTGSHSAGTSTTNVMSPLQPARISLSVIQLKSIIRRPLRRLVSNSAAPALPFSSIAVSTASSGGCGMSVESSRARM